jgi:peptide deformylase
VKRFKKIEVRALDLEGNNITVTAEDLIARIFQHEVDHLNGILYIDRLDRRSKRELLARINEIRLNN